MSSQTEFKEQGGIATMDPSWLRRWIISKLMTRLSSEQHMLKKREKAEKNRAKQNAPHTVEYFHQVDDGYSHLAVQTLKQLIERYNIELKTYLVTGPEGQNVAEPELLDQIGLNDAKAVAPYHDLMFPEVSSLPSEENKSLATQILANLSSEQFISHATDVSLALWQNNSQKLTELSEQFGIVDKAVAEQVLTDGNARRKQIKHYSGAMFYYGDEWYWGVDRLYHLEQRLRDLKQDKTPNAPDTFPRHAIIISDTEVTKSITLEIYASLRSPYTAIAFDRAVQLAKDSGINYKVRPVLPMVMRGVPATKEKGFYILFDTGREARAAGVPYGNVSDPIGEPARNGYKLYFWARQFGKGTEFFSNFLSAAFAEGINTNKPAGLKYVIEKTGLNWLEAQQQLANTQWQEQLESNRLVMYEAGIWGVPSFRLLDSENNELCAVWGQDRLWLIAREIQKYCG